MVNRRLLVVCVGLIGFAIYSATELLGHRDSEGQSLVQAHGSNDRREKRIVKADLPMVRRNARDPQVDSDHGNGTKGHGAEPAESQPFSGSTRYEFLKQAVYGGGLSRQDNPYAYAAAIVDLAQMTLKDQIDRQNNGRTAWFAGFASESDMLTIQANLEVENQELAGRLVKLVSESRSASLSAALCAKGALFDPLHLEMFDYEHLETSEVWRQRRDIGISSQYSFGMATSAGDRGFRLHFDSAFFPELEVTLLRLVEQKNAFWSDYNDWNQSQAMGDDVKLHR